MVTSKHVNGCATLGESPAVVGNDEYAPGFEDNWSVDNIEASMNEASIARSVLSKPQLSLLLRPDNIDVKTPLIDIAHPAVSSHSRFLCNAIHSFPFALHRSLEL